jgi:predicted RNA-binding protein YlxR (DUF448 family)
MIKTAERTSFYSHKKAARESLVRFVMKDHSLVLDAKKSLPGRGAYLLPEEVSKVLECHLYSHAFHQSVSLLEEEQIKKAYESLTK